MENKKVVTYTVTGKGKYSDFKHETSDKDTAKNAVKSLGVFLNTIVEAYSDGTEQKVDSIS